MDSPGEPIPPTPYRFSNEELRALQECNSESFFQRALPLSTLFGVGTYTAVKSGMLSGSGKYGAVPKVVVAVVAGYILGKISYQSKCIEKIMALPNSKLGAMLRERKRSGKFNETLSLNQPDLGKILEEIPQSDTYSDMPKKSSYLDFDTERPNSNFPDDLYRPNLDDPKFNDDSPVLEPSNRSTSYDELRRQNREMYEANRKQLYQRSPAKPDNYPPPASRQEPPPPEHPKSTNLYGDIWDK